MVLTVLIVSFFAMLFIGFPVAMAMGSAGVIGILLSSNVSARALAQTVLSNGNSFSLMAMPFFMLGGQIMEATGITQELVNFSRKLVGWMRGGLAYTTTVAGVLMAGISGSSNADTAAIGSITLRPLIDEGWSEGMAVSIVASAGGLGPVIPPSIAMIIFASLTNMSVGSLFMAGYVPGIMLALTYMAIETIYARKHDLPRHRFGGFKELGKAFLSAFWALLMPVIIIVSILSGVCTATEAGVISVIYGIIYGFLTRRLTFQKLFTCAYNAVLNSVGPMSIIIMAGIVGKLFTTAGLSKIMENWFVSVSGSKIVFGFLLIAILTVAGMFMDGSATMLILLPILTPIVGKIGMSMIHFALIYKIASCSGGLTPPVGATLFICCAMGDIPIKKCVRAIIPFVGAMILVAILIVFFPILVEWLPRLVGYTV